MRFLRCHSLLALLVLFLFPMFQGDVVAGAPQLENIHFQETWNRSDLPVEEGVVARSWIWGSPISDILSEPYAESPDGRREIQYFDKSRMEITQPGGDATSIWYVTNGLLVVELITGEMQTGDDEFVARFPSEIPVAGDNLPQNGPSYATFRHLLDPVEDRGIALITERLDWEADVGSDPQLEALGVQTAFYDEVTGHNIAAPFWEFMNSSGTIWEGGQYVDGLLFPNPFYATGRPITEPYWSDVTVAGTERLVLLQCFERRCLTYTPDNPDGWQVEAGNVGQHYFQWRYERSQRDGLVLFEQDGELFTVMSDGSSVQTLTAGFDLFASDAEWSPDGSHIAFVGSSDNLFAEPGSIFVINADGTGLQQITDGSSDSSPSWSPDGGQLAFERVMVDRDDPDDLFDRESQIFIADLSAATVLQLTDVPRETNFSISQSPSWSPDGEWIVFSNQNGIPGPGPLDSTLFLIRPDGSEVTALAETGGNAQPIWSPTGESIVYERQPGGSDDFVGRLLRYISLADGVPIDVAGGDRADPDDPDWSPSGESLVFSQRVARYSVETEIRRYDLATSTTTLLTHFGRQPDWSPDGEHLVVATDGGIVRMNSDGTNPWLIRIGGSSPQWQPGP